MMNETISTADQPAREAAPRKRYGVLATLRSRLRRTVIDLRWLYLVKFWGMDVHRNTMISLKANLDRTNPRGIHIGDGTAVNFDAVILTHDIARGLHADTRIGKCCLIGARAIVMPGLTVGDHSIVGAGAVVTKDVPPGSIVAGNPARIIRTGITTAVWGRITERGTAAAKD